MRRLFKALLWCGSLAALLGAALLLFVVTADPNEHKERIAALLSAQLARTVTLDGELALSFYPWLTLEVGGLRVDNTEGFGPQPFLTAQRLRLRARTLPLLRGNYVVDTALIQGLTVNLARDGQGRSNWTGLVDADSDSWSAVMQPLAGVTLGGLAIEEAQITWADEQADTRYAVTDLDVSSAALRYGEPMSLRANFGFSRQQPALAAAVDMQGVITYDIDAQRYRVEPLQLRAVLEGEDVPGGVTEATFSAAMAVDAEARTLALTALDLSALGVTLQGALRAADIDSPAPDIRASLALRGADLALPLRIAGIEPLASWLAAAARRDFALNADLDADLKRGDIDVSELSAQLLGMTLDGAFKARNIHSDSPAVQGRLKANGPDLPLLLQALGQFQGDTGPDLTGYGEQLVGAAVKRFRVEGAFDADLKSGDLSISGLSLAALGVDVSGALTASNMHTRKGTVEGHLALRAQRPMALLQALGQPDLALRSATLNMQLQGTSEAINLAPFSAEITLADARVAGGIAQLGLDATARVGLADETLRVSRFALRGLGLQTTGNVMVRGFLTDPEYAGELQAQPFNLRRLAQSLGQQLGASADPDAFSRVALNTRFKGAASELSLDELQLQLDDSRINGELRMDAWSTAPELAFDLALDQLDLGRYLPPSAENQSAPPMALPVAALRALALDGALRIDQLLVSDLALQQVALRLRAGDGVLTAESLTAALYEGRLAAELRLDVTPERPYLAVDSTLQGVRVEQLLTDLNGKAALRGSGDLSATLTANGADSEQIKRSLRGRMRVQLRDGAVRGFNLGKALRAWKQFKTGAAVAFQDTEATDFIELTGNPVITDGVMRLDDLYVEAPVFRLQGRGVLADLHTDSIDYQTLLAVVDTAGDDDLSGLVGLELPVNISGALQDPRVRLDWGRVLQPLIVRGIVDALNLPGPDPADEAADAPAAEDRELPSEAELARELLKEGLKRIFD